MKYRTIAAAVLAASTACADTNTVSTTWTEPAQTILITATRTQNNSRRIAGNPTIIEATQLQKGAYAGVPEVLGARAGLHVRNYSDNPGRASVDMRGFGENSHGRVLVLVNGRRLNRPDLAPLNWSQIPVDNIDRIEVVRGPRSALYGDYAVGGVINIITKRGREEMQADIGVMGGSHGFNDEHAGVAGDLGGTGYNAFFGHQSADGYRDRSAYETWSGSLSLERDLSDSFSSWIDYTFVDADYELPGGLSEAQLQQDRRQSVNPDDDARESFHNLGAGIGMYPGDRHEATIDIGYSRKDIESNMASFFSFNTWTIDTYTLSPKYVYSASPFDRDNRFTFGVDVGYDNLEIDLFADRAHTVRNGSSTVGKTTAGLYGYDEFNLADNLILSAGARTEQARYSIEERDGTGAVVQDTSDRHNVSAYDAGLTYLPGNNLKLFARFNRLYRLPFVDEQISYQGFGSGFNKELDPETGYAYEIGADWAAADDLDLQCTLFRMDMKDEIAYAVTNFSTFEGANFNMDETRHQGIELAATWQLLESLGLYANYTCQNVEYTEGVNNGNKVPLVPANLLSAGLDLALLDPLHLLTDVTFTDEQFAGSAADNSAGTELDAYTVVDVALRYTLSVRKTETELFAGVDNLFGEEYSPVAYGGFGTIYAYYPAPERTYKAGLRVRF
jgi:iron complex outermembrane receptor protein